MSSKLLLCLLFAAFHIAANAEDTYLDDLAAPVTEVCLECMCEAISGCDRTVTCIDHMCGLFKITEGYWIDAGKPMLPNQDAANETAFPNCANDPYCAALTVQSYMEKLGVDCNRDGVINCYDYGAIHLLGSEGCKGEQTNPYFNRLDKCLKQMQKIQG